MAVEKKRWKGFDSADQLVLACCPYQSPLQALLLGRCFSKLIVSDDDKFESKRKRQYKDKHRNTWNKIVKYSKDVEFEEKIIFTFNLYNPNHSISNPESDRLECVISRSSVDECMCVGPCALFYTSLIIYEFKLYFCLSCLRVQKGKCIRIRCLKLFPFDANEFGKLQNKKDDDIVNLSNGMIIPNYLLKYQNSYQNGELSKIDLAVIKEKLGPFLVQRLKFDNEKKLDNHIKNCKNLCRSYCGDEQAFDQIIKQCIKNCKALIDMTNLCDNENDSDSGFDAEVVCNESTHIWEKFLFDIWSAEHEDECKQLEQGRLKEYFKSNNKCNLIHNICLKKNTLRLKTYDQLNRERAIKSYRKRQMVSYLFFFCARIIVFFFVLPYYYFVLYFGLPK